MGKLIKINMYAERKNHKHINMNELEKNFSDYEKWLEKTNNCDGIENYKKFLKSS